MINFVKVNLFLIVFSILSVLFFYEFVTDSFSRSEKEEREARLIYKEITNKIDTIGGEYKQYGGRVNSGFILSITLPESKSDESRKDMFVKIFQEIGFSKKDITLKNGSVLLCRNNKGILISASH